MKSALPPLFWIVASLDAILFLIMLSSFLKQGANSSGGREMGIFFYVMLPSIVLVGAALVFGFSRSDFWRYTALLIVAGPGLLLGGVSVRSAMIDYRVTQNRLGRGYFSGSAMKEMGAAVVAGDLEAMKRLAPKIDINAVGQPQRLPGMTLMRLAGENAFDKDSDKSSPADLMVIRTLLALGAKPNPGLDSALRIKHGQMLTILLDAGADANMRFYDNQPMIFRWLSVISLTNFRAMADHGLDLNSSDHQSPLCVDALFSERWDIVNLLIDLGADIQKPDDSGRTVASEAERKVTECERAGQVPNPGLLEVRTKLQRLATEEKPRLKT